MKWEIRHPIAWRSLIGMGNAKAFCTSTDRGEYVIVGRNGMFGVELDGVMLTALDMETVVKAMEEAEEIDKALAGRM